MKIHVSKENIKLGKIANISFPQDSCQPDVPCKQDCYTNKSYKMYPNTRKAWHENYQYYLDGQERFFRSIEDWLWKNKPSFFRWFVSGDIPSQSFFIGMDNIADSFDKIKFLVFTKNHQLHFDSKNSNNLQVVLSMWTGWGDSTIHPNMRRAWVQTKDQQETRIPIDAIQCFGNCEKCGICFQLDGIGRDVFFMKH